MGLRQAELGKLLGLTQSYVANMETGRFPTTLTFAVKLAGKSGVDVSSIISRARIPLDSEGREYTEVSYLAFRDGREEKLNQIEFEKAIMPIGVALHASADIGKRKVFTNILNATLGETIRAVEGLEQAIADRLQEARRLAEAKSQTRSYTYGELRKNNALARALGFEDIPERGSGDIALKIRVVGAETVNSRGINENFTDGKDGTEFLLESTYENGGLRWSALFGGKSAMTEKDIDYIKSLIKK
jgi:transcriptional regulator with XRE-family HTH domain